MSEELALARTRLRALPKYVYRSFRVPRDTPVMHAAIVRETPRVIDIKLLGSDVIRRPSLKFGDPVVMLSDMGRKLMGRRP